MQHALNTPATRDGPRIYGVGAAKTGTHSLAAMFPSQIRSMHEADAEHLIELHLEREVSCECQDIRAFLRERDQHLQLKVDVSQVNIYLLDDLETLFPESLYILTVRHPITWLRSIIDDSLRRGTTETWMRFRHYIFGYPSGFCAHERILEDNGLFTLRGYLTYWRDAIERG